MPATPRPALVHPEIGDVELVAVLHALADPTRLTIVQTLRAEPERPCGTFPVRVAPSTLSHHFRVLREAGVIRQREDGNRRLTTLRLAELDSRFPDLIDTVLSSLHNPPAGAACREVVADAGIPASGDLHS